MYIYIYVNIYIYIHHVCLCIYCLHFCTDPCKKNQLHFWLTRNHCFHLVTFLGSQVAGWYWRANLRKAVFKSLRERRGETWLQQGCRKLIRGKRSSKNTSEKFLFCLADSCLLIVGCWLLVVACLLLQIRSCVFAVRPLHLKKIPPHEV